MYLYNMKSKLVFFGIIIFLISCESNEYSLTLFESATIENIEAPDELIFEENNTFEVTFKIPTDCHTFSEFEITGSENDLFVDTKLRFQAGNQNCTETTDLLMTQNLEIFVDTEEEYTIKFLVGQSSSGQFQYETFQIPVIN